MFDLVKKKTPPTTLGRLKSLRVDMEDSLVHVCYCCGYEQAGTFVTTKEVGFTVENDFDKVLRVIGLDLNAVEDYAKIHERGDD